MLCLYGGVPEQEGERGSNPPAFEEQGQMGTQAPFLCFLLIEFFIFSPYICSSLTLDLLLPSGIHQEIYTLKSAEGAKGAKGALTPSKM